MSEDRSAQPRSWFGRLTQAFSDEPKTRQDVLELLREATEENVLDYEALNIIEGAMQVSEMQVRDIMIPRSQMAVVNAEQTPKEFLPLIISSAHSRFPVIGESPDEVIGCYWQKICSRLLSKTTKKNSIFIASFAKQRLSLKANA